MSIPERDGSRDRSNSSTGMSPPQLDRKKTMVTVEDFGVRRSLEDFEPKRTSISGTRPSIESIISYSNNSSSSKLLRGKKEKKAMKTEESVNSEFQRVEESLDL